MAQYHGKQLKDLPESTQVIKASENPASLLALGDAAVDYVMPRRYQYDQNWFDRLIRAIAAVRDVMESKMPSNSAVAELTLVLLRPSGRLLSRAEVADLTEPSEEEVEAWAWGHDTAKTARFFVASVVLTPLSLLAFAVITFGLESPGTTATIVFLSLGSMALAAASSVFGKGLYQQYVVKGYISWTYRGYPEATVARQTAYHKKRLRLWFVYVAGTVFLAISVGLGIVLGKNLLSQSITDYTTVRLAMLSSAALGMILFAAGAWPIVRQVVVTAEAERRLGRAKYLSSPRLLLTSLPLLASTVSLLINWLFL